METDTASVEQKLRIASPGELYRAAEAVVDAAICCHNVSLSAPISEETRELLVKAVYEDPKLTVHLFDY